MDLVCSLMAFKGRVALGQGGGSLGSRGRQHHRGMPAAAVATSGGTAGSLLWLEAVRGVRHGYGSPA